MSPNTSQASAGIAGVTRLLRQVWTDPNELAQEIYALLYPPLDITASQVTISSPPNATDPSLVINQNPNSSTGAIQINQGSTSYQFGGGGGDGSITFGGTTTGAITFGGNTFGGSTYGGTTFPSDVPPPSTLNFNGLPVPPQTIVQGVGPSGSGSGGPNYGAPAYPNPGGPSSIPLAGLGPLVFYGQVASQSGGQVYAVECWAVSPLLGPAIGTLQVRFPMVDPNETIPTGAIIIVMAFPGKSGSDTVILDAVGFIGTFFPVP